MADASFLAWPFFEARHRALRAAARRLGRAHARIRSTITTPMPRAARWSAALGRDGWLEATAPLLRRRRRAARRAHALRSSRETLARHDGLADFAFAMQGLGAGADLPVRHRRATRRWLPRTRAGTAIAAFALTEPESGSDVAGDRDDRAARRRRLRARRREDLDLERRHRRPLRRLRAHRRGAGRQGVSAPSSVPASTPGLGDRRAARGDRAASAGARCASRAAACPPHALIGRRARASASRWRRSTSSARRSAPRRSASRAARSTRALAACAGRASCSAAPLADLQMVQGQLADMALDVDAAALLVYRAAWAKDTGAARITREAAMAKLYATEAAQRVIDAAVQLHGGDGVRAGPRRRAALPRDPGAAHLRRGVRRADA